MGEFIKRIRFTEHKIIDAAKQEFPNHLIQIDGNTVHIFGDYTLESLNWFMKWFGVIK